MFGREGSSVVDRVDISAHLPYCQLWGHTARFSGDCSRHSKPSLQALARFR
jgi:hypothetical protein